MVSSSPERLVVGHLNKAHGTKGEVFIWPLTERPEETFVVGSTFEIGEGETGTEPSSHPPMEIEEARPYKKGYLVRFKGVLDRNMAEALRGLYILRAVEDLSPREDGEYFYHELLGMAVETVEGESVGIVTEVYPVEPSHLLQVTQEEKSRIIPFSNRILREVDLEGRKIVIEPLPGLLDL